MATGVMNSFNSSNLNFGGSQGLVNLDQPRDSGVGTVGAVAGAVANIATGFINANRIKSTLEFNAKMSELQGRMVRLSADIQIKNIRKKASTLFSYQRAAYAKAGFKMEGSPAKVMADSLREAELDAIYADISATYNVNLTSAQAGIYRMQEESAKNDAWMKAFNTILKTASSVQRG